MWGEGEGRGARGRTRALQLDADMHVSSSPYGMHATLDLEAH